MQHSKIKKVLIANRGLVVARIARTLKNLNIDYFAPKESLQSFLDIEKMISIAKKQNCDALHPGWGFLSENFEFAQRCEEENLNFIGPSAENIKLMGSKDQAKAVAKKIKVPTATSLLEGGKDFLKACESLNFPIIFKPVAGGGGKGMLHVNSVKELKSAYEEAKRVAKSSFGDDQLMVEELIYPARHVEVQIVADEHGNISHLFERDCTIQRRHQKVIEESPSPFISDKQRQAILSDAVKLAQAIHYQNVGTVEFLLDEQGQHYFMEMNTRLQVEHGVTELRTGQDLVELQMKIAQGEKVQLNVQVKNNHAMQVRVYSEYPYEGFLPSIGKISLLKWPQDDVRIEQDLKKRGPCG